MQFLEKLNIVKRLKNKIRTMQDEIHAMQYEIHRLRRQVYDLSSMIAFSNEIQKQNPTYAYTRKVHELTEVKDCPDSSLVRVGRDHDGGYIMADCFTPDMIAYSFGICDDVSWDKAMAARGIQVYMYDHTIESLPENDPYFHFNRIGVCGKEEREQCLPLKAILEKNGHAQNKKLILKMDVEGAEYEAMDCLDAETLANFDQMVFELHDLGVPKNHKNVLNFLEKIRLHHEIVDIHANNSASVTYLAGLALPNLLEITCLRRESRHFVTNRAYYPREFHSSNIPNYPDLQLGVWNDLD